MRAHSVAHSHETIKTLTEFSYIHIHIFIAKVANFMPFNMLNGYFVSILTGQK